MKKNHIMITITSIIINAFLETRHYRDRSQWHSCLVYQHKNLSHESFANVAYCYGKEQIPTSNKEHCSNETVNIIRNIKSSLASWHRKQQILYDYLPLPSFGSCPHLLYASLLCSTWICIVKLARQLMLTIWQVFIIGPDVVELSLYTHYNT